MYSTSNFAYPFLSAEKSTVKFSGGTGRVTAPVPDAQPVTGWR